MIEDDENIEKLKIKKNYLEIELKRTHVLAEDCSCINYKLRKRNLYLSILLIISIVVNAVLLLGRIF